ncbi:MAG: Fic family protein [Hydrogenobaculum sp.]
MRDKDFVFIKKRADLLDTLGGLPEPVVKNEEWLYLFKEETRNSIMIEGYFVSEDDLEDVITKNKAITRDTKEALNYYKAAKYFYSLAFESYKSKEFLFGHSVIRQIAKTVLDKPIGYRTGDIVIVGAKLNPPSGFLIKDWIDVYVEFVKNEFKNVWQTSTFDLERFLDFLVRQHVLFESIHPFEDGNGRTGRIITNYLLISIGLPPIIIKGKEKDRVIYINALEKADKSLRILTKSPSFPEKESIFSRVQESDIAELSHLFKKALRESLDRIILSFFEKRGINLKSSKEVAKALGYSENSLRKLIERGYFLALKKGKTWFTHELFDLRKEDYKTHFQTYL